MGEVPRARHAREGAVEVPGEPVEGTAQLVDVPGLGSQPRAAVQTRVVEGADVVGPASHHHQRDTRAPRRRGSRRPRGSAPRDTPSATPAAIPFHLELVHGAARCSVARGMPEVRCGASPTARSTDGTVRVSASSSSCTTRARGKRAALAVAPPSVRRGGAHRSPAAASPARKPNTSAGPGVAPPAAVAVPKGLAATLPARRRAPAPVPAVPTTPGRGRRWRGPPLVPIQPRWTSTA